MKQQNTKARTSLPMGSIMMRAAGVLLCLVLFSTHLMGGLYARYTTSGTAEDEARVAKFDVTVAGEVLEHSYLLGTCTAQKAYPGQRWSQPVKIENKSETAVEYALTVTGTGNLPLEFTCPEGFAGALTPGEQAELTVEILWPKNQNDPKYSYEIDHITFALICQQVD